VSAACLQGETGARRRLAQWIETQSAEAAKGPGEAEATFAAVLALAGEEGS
jgi:hypothetical protein